MTGLVVFEAVIAPLLVLAVATGIAFAVRVAPKLLRFLDDWQGEPARPGVAARPGVLERLAMVEQQVAEVHYEVKPNGGGSFADDVRRGLGMPLKKEEAR